MSHESAFHVLWIGGTPELCQQASAFSIAVQPAQTGAEALLRLRNGRFDAAMVDLPIDGWSAEELLEELHSVHALTPVIFRHPSPTLDDAVRLTKLGAFYFFDAEASLAQVAHTVEAAVDYRRSRELALFGSALQEPWRKFLLGDSPAMQSIVQLVRLVGARRCTVLISGETGTGKEMAARALHMASNRSHLPMCAVNCSALPENLLEAELFGHVKGAFTGAIQTRVGRFEQAHRSTLFLDEIGDMPLDLQAKLLRVLQEREFQRLGSSETIQVDVRVIAASNADLCELVRKGKFREDLYYRLNVVPLHMPPLRERRTDIPILVHHFLDKVCRIEDLPPRRVADETLRRLQAYPWPGNVRQLENAVEMAVALSGDRDLLSPADFPMPAAATRDVRPSSLSIAVPDHGIDFEETVGQLERDLLHQALQKSGGNKQQAAALLGLKRTTLAAKLKSLDPGVAAG